MLFKNDQKYTLTKEDYQKISQIIGCGYQEKSGKLSFIDYPKGGVMVLPPPTTVHKNPDGTETLNKPAFQIIPYEQNLETDEGTVKWDYCTRPPVVKPGESPKYEGDREKLLTHRFAVQQNQPDLLFYLCCISRCGAHHKEANVITYRIENKKAEASAQINKMMQKVNVEAAILHVGTRIHETDLIRIAKGMRVSETDDLTPDEIRYELIKKIESMEASIAKNGYSTFLSFIDSTSPVGSRSDLLAGLQLLKDRKMIKWQAVSHKWVTTGADGKKTGDICSLVSGKDPDDSLEHHVITDPQIGEMVGSLIKTAQQTEVPAQ